MKFFFMSCVAYQPLMLHGITLRYIIEKLSALSCQQGYLLMRMVSNSVQTLIDHCNSLVVEKPMAQPKKSHVIHGIELL